MRQTWLNSYLVNWCNLADGFVGIISLGQYHPGLAMKYISWTFNYLQNHWFWRPE